MIMFFTIDGVFNKITCNLNKQTYLFKHFVVRNVMNPFKLYQTGSYKILLVLLITTHVVLHSREIEHNGPEDRVEYWGVVDGNYESTYLLLKYLIVAVFDVNA